MSDNHRKFERAGILRFTFAVALLIGSSITVLAQQAGVADTEKEPKQAAAAAVHQGVDPQSGFRLPLPKREDLDDLGKKLYDQYATPNPQSLAGLRGPAGIRLYSPLEAEHESIHNHYLRFDAGFSPRIRELAILVSAREADSQFEWAAHEPAARKAGLDPKIIDIVRFRKSPAGLPETETVIIQLGREMFGQKKVSSETFARALKILARGDWSTWSL